MNKENEPIDYHTSGTPLADAEPRDRGFAHDLLVHLRISIVATLVLALIVSGLYPALVWGIAQVLFPRQANGSLIGKDGKPVSKDEDAVGSALIGQSFSDAKYFHPRPSSAGNGYDPTASGGSNLGPTSAKLFNGTTKKDDKGNEIVDFDGIHDRIVHYCMENDIPYRSSLPLKQFIDAHGNLDDVKLIKAFNSDNPVIFVPSEPIPADAVTGSASGLDPHISPANAQRQKNRVARARGISPDKIQKLIDDNTDKPSLGIFGEPGVNVLRLNLALDQTAPAVAPTTAPITASATNATTIR